VAYPNIAARGTSAVIMKRSDLVSVPVILPRRFINYPMILPEYSAGTVTSTAIIGSRIYGSALSKASLKEYLVAI